MMLGWPGLASLVPVTPATLVGNATRSVQEMLSWVISNVTFAGYCGKLALPVDAPGPSGTAQSLPIGFAVPGCRLARLKGFRASNRGAAASAPTRPAEFLLKSWCQ